MKHQEVVDEFKDSVEVKMKFVEEYGDKIYEIAEKCVESLKKGGKVIYCGNGGSSADAQHLAAELVGKYRKNRKALMSIALTSNSSDITSVANDYGYEFTFERGVEAWGKKGDIFVGMSTSGKATNVLRGVKKAKELGLFTIAFTGSKGEKLAKEVDFAFMVPSETTARIQETYMLLGHVLSGLIEDMMFPNL